MLAAIAHQGVLDFSSSWGCSPGASTIALTTSWVSAGVDSSVEYNLTGTSVTGGRILAQGYVNSSNQGSPSINILKEAIFASQLERNTFTGARFELVIEMAIDATGGTLGAYVSLDWEEVSR